MKAFVRVAWLVVQKDLTVEIRSLEIVSTTLFFAITVVLVFSFGLIKEGRAPDDVAPAILWIAIAFAGTLALGRTFDRERQNETLRALLLAPADRPALYVGKLLGIVLLLGLVELLLVLLVGLTFPGADLCRAIPARRRCCWPARSGLHRWGRSLPRCWCVRAAATCCCLSCCIR